MGGAIFVVVALTLTPYGGWHKEAKEWTDRVAHTGDKVPHDAWDERFEHPARTWASASHRAFVAMANATYMYTRVVSLGPLARFDLLGSLWTSRERLSLCGPIAIATAVQANWVSAIRLVKASL
jgi:hypothetical protein